MTAIEDEELWALLDGELDPPRARAVRAAIAGDPALAARFAALDRLDAGLRHSADAAAFEPRVAFPAERERGWAWAPAAGAALVALRVLSKVDNFAAVGIALQLCALAAIMVLLVRSPALGDRELAR